MTSLATARVGTVASPDICLRAAILLCAASAIAPTPVLAEIQVRGSPEAVRIEARDTPVEDILAALGQKFGVHYQLSAPLDKRVSGTYVGPLRRVVTRILDGYNFILKTDNGSIAVTVVGTPDGAAAVPASPGPKVVQQPPVASAAAQPPSAGEGRARPTPSVSTAAPSPTVDLTERLPFPTPERPTSGSAPAPVPELRQSAAPAPAPPAPGSKAFPAPEPGPSTGVPSPVAGPTPPSAPRRSQ